MAQIQPIPIWFKGEQIEANIFNCYSSYDNLTDLAIIKYQLIENIIISPEEQTSKTLLSDDVTIDGADYIQWDAEINANEWIYNWAANKLGLTITTL